MEYMSVKELQEELKINKNSAYALIHSGRIPVIQVGRTYRVPRSLFEAWVENEANKIENKL